MNIVIFPNLMKKDAYSCTVEVCDILTKLGADVYMDLKYYEQFKSNNLIKFDLFSNVICHSDIAIAIGGDGTILKCASKMTNSNTRLLGINTGRLGFMASVEKDELVILKNLFTNEYKISERMRLKAELVKDNRTLAYYALNDVVVSGEYARIADFDVFVNNNLIGNYRADGIVFSTPTGSTAYSLSAGGPIIEPELECIEMNLICPHSLFTRPMIYSDDKIITLIHNSPESANIFFCVDGNEAIPLARGQKLTITKSENKVKLIDMTGITFYDSLNKKLMQSLKGN